MTDNWGLAGRPDSQGVSRHIPRDGTARDELFVLLSHARRRRTLAYLRCTERAVPVEELAKHIAVAEVDGQDSVRPQQRRQIGTSLHHVHLPKLVDADLLAWRDATERAAVRATAAGRTLPTTLSWLPAGSNVADH